MSGLYGRPTAAELIAAVAEFLDDDVRRATGPDGQPAEAAQVNFHARVATNVLRIVERELLDDRPGPDLLGFANETELAMAIRAGDLDDRPDDVLAALRTIVRRRLDVNHPGYAES